MRVDSLNLIRRKKLKLHLERAKEAQRRGRWGDAYEAYRLVLRNDGRRFGILVQMGHMSKELGDFAQAEAHYYEALQLKPNDWDLHVQLGHLYNRAGSLEKAKSWYSKANDIQQTRDVSELLHTMGETHRARDTGALRNLTLDQMDSRRFHQALPNALTLYDVHGLRDFDVILGHAYRELGRYADARKMYEKYFERCIESNSRHLNDAFWQLMNILEIQEERHEVLKLFARLKRHYFQTGNYADFGGEQEALLKSHIGKIYGVLRC